MRLPPILATLSHVPTTEQPPTRGHRKKARTRRQLIEAGLLVLASRGEAMTVTDVVNEAGVSNGTFYNYFSDIDELTLVLAEHVALAIAEAAAAQPIDDPAERFAYATARILTTAEADPVWGRGFLRFATSPASGAGDMMRHPRQDVTAGHRLGRFSLGADAATLDQVSGLVVMTIHRIVDGRGNETTVVDATTRGLTALGMDAAEARAVAARTVERARADAAR